MALSKIVSSSLANGSVSIASITDNTVTSAKLTSTGVVANSYGNTTAIPVITVDAQGRITNATTSSVSGVTGLSFTPANSTVTVSTSTTNFDAAITSGNSTVQGLLKVVDSVSNTSTAIASSANSVTTAYQLAANAVSNATAYAATAYSNAVATAASDATTKAGTAYSNATSYADTVAGTAYSNAVSVAASDATTKAGTAYSNAVSYANTAAGTAYSNAISFANTIAYTAAGTAYSNAVTTAASDATTKAGTAYSNATSYADTKAATAYSNVFNGGTFSGAVVVQANLTANSVRLNGDLQIDGNLTVLGNTVSIFVSTLSVEDNMIYLNSNSITSNPDLGFAGNYNDGSYAHAGLFRDATDGVWKFFHGYTPEPDASAFIDTANASFTLSNLQINYVIGNVTGSANSATYLGGNTATTLRSYSDTIAGTAYSNATSYADTKAATAYSNAVSVAASDATTKAGTAYSNATTYAATIAGTAYSNAVSVAASDATTKAGTAYSNATTYAATIAGTAYSNATSYAATIAGTAYSNAVAYAASNSYVNSTFLKLTGGSLTGNVATSAYIHANGTSGATGGYFGMVKIGYGSSYGTVERTDSDLYLQYNNAYNVVVGYGGGYLTATNSSRAPIFYDSNDTAFYIDPANSGSSLASSGAFNGNIQVTPRSASWAEGIQFYMPTTSTWGGLRWVRNNSNFYGSWYMGWTALDSSNDIVFGSNVSGTQVDNIMRLYHSTSGSARIGRDLYLSGLTGGNYGNRLIVGNTSTSYTLQDGNIRPTIQVHGAYPVLSLNHTVTTNASHGPTVQFTANGTGSQFVIGMNGTGTQLDIGLSSTSDWNPHNGIASYSGTTGWRMDNSGNVYNLVSNRSPIFYDSSDTGYYWNPATSSAHRLQTPSGYLDLGPMNTSWCHFQTDRGQFYFNSRTHHDGGISSYDSNDYAYFPVYYDYNDTGYYTDPNSYSKLRGLTFGVYGDPLGYNGGNYDINFYGFRDTGQDFFGAKIRGQRSNNCCGNPAYLCQGVYLQFYTFEGCAGSNGDANLGLRATFSNDVSFTGNVTAYSSDKRLKTNIRPIENAMEKVNQLSGFTFNWNELANKLAEFNTQKNQIGVFAQDVEEVLPEAVALAPFDVDHENGKVSKSGENYLTVQYEKLVPLLIEALKEQDKRIQELEKKINDK